MFCMDYVIMKGDSLYSISRQFHVPVSTIIDANPLINVYNLMVGERLCIPDSMPNSQFKEYTTYLVEEEDTLGSVLDKNGINLADLMMHNSLDDIYLMPGSTLQVPITGAGESGITL